MLFCSSVDVAGSVIPAGDASVNAAVEGSNRVEIRSTTATMPAANRAEIRAISKIWRAESLYMKLLSSLKRIQFVPIRCCDNNRRLCSAAIVPGARLTNLRSLATVLQERKSLRIALAGVLQTGRERPSVPGTKAATLETRQQVSWFRFFRPLNRPIFRRGSPERRVE